MFCYTYLTSLECGLRELILWSEISSEHPIFIVNVARCLNLNLTPELVAGLDRVNKCFDSISQEARRLLSMIGSQYSNTMNCNSIAQAAAQLMQQFLQYDQEFITIIQQLKSIGQNQPVWQTLLNHIETEQIYMYRLISTLMQQIFQASPQPFNMMPPQHP